MSWGPGPEESKNKDMETEHLVAPPRDVTLVENPKAPTSFFWLKEGPCAGPKAEDTERRHDVASSLFGTSQANKIRDEAITPLAIFDNLRCNVKVDLSFTFCTVSAADIIDSDHNVHGPI